MVAGVALLDYDGDGYLDVYLVNGAAIPSLKKESPAYWNRLFHNNHDGTFTDVTEKAGVAGAGYGMGVAVGDYDNDGRPDLFVANVTGNQLFHNNGDGTFTDVTAKAGLAGATARRKENVVRRRGLVRLQQRWPARSLRRQLLQVGGQQRSLLHDRRRRAWLLPSQVLHPDPQLSLPKQWRRDVHRCFRGNRNRRAVGQGHERVVRRLRRRRISGCVRGQRHDAQFSVPQSWREEI